ncbi:MAG: type III pantothenate kinase [Erysipelotrichaceae bacterium]|nr:type III pantothenate kinase [Erysipelotrichaceae bacterium]
MKACVDVGNTTIGIGIVNGNELIQDFTINTEKNKSEDEYYFSISRILRDGKVELEKIEIFILSSVVPNITKPLYHALERIFSCRGLIVGPSLKSGIPIKIDNPSELGADLVADVVAARSKYGFPSVIIDLGTATKLLVIDKNGSYIGGIIAPGLTISSSCLTSSASLLPNVALEIPSKVVGKNTIDAMNSGLVYGHSEMIKGLLFKIEKELGYPFKRIITGGNAQFIIKLFDKDVIYDRNLVYIGLNELIEKNRGNK